MNLLERGERDTWQSTHIFKIAYSWYILGILCGILEYSCGSHGGSCKEASKPTLRNTLEGSLGYKRGSRGWFDEHPGRVSWQQERLPGVVDFLVGLGRWCDQSLMKMNGWSIL